MTKRGWNENSEHVLESLKRIEATANRTCQVVQQVQTDLALLKFKASMAGGLSGLLVTMLFKQLFH